MMPYLTGIFYRNDYLVALCKLVQPTWEAPGKLSANAFKASSLQEAASSQRFPPGSHSERLRPPPASLRPYRDSEEYCLTLY